MSTKIAVNPPKTPVTEGSGDIAAATLPNMCKMPGPPAPFVPTPFPNIGKSSDNLSDCTTTVKFEGSKVAIKGTTYKSTGSPDLASKGTGGGVVSSTEEGTTAFAAPGSMNVKAEGKNIQLLGDAMLNNGSSNPYNSGTPSGNVQNPESPDAMAVLQAIVDKCENSVPHSDAKGKKSCTKLGAEKHACCEDAIQKHRAANPPNGNPPLEGEKGYSRPPLDQNNRPVLDANGKSAPPSPVPGSRQSLFRAAVAGALAAGTSVKKAIGKALGGKCFPDAAILNPDGSKTMVDFKFPCPPGHPSGKGTSKGGASTSMSPRQQGAYDSLSIGSCDSTAQTILPQQLSFGF